MTPGETRRSAPSEALRMKSSWPAATVVVALAAMVAVAYVPVWSSVPAAPPDRASDPLVSTPAAPDGLSGGLLFCSDPWPPFAALAGGAREGYAVEIVRRILERRGRSVRYANRPWSACLDDVRRGIVAGTPAMEPADAPDFVYPQEAVGRSVSTFYVRPGDPWRYAGVESLRGRRLGVVQDYSYAPDLDVYVRGGARPEDIFEATGAEALARLVTALREGRIDGFLETAPVVAATLDALGVPRDAVVPAGVLPAKRVLVGLSPRRRDARALADEIDEGIRALRASGELACILARYGVPDWGTP